jgi:hypothetical protein
MRRLTAGCVFLVLGDDQRPGMSAVGRAGTTGASAPKDAQSAIWRVIPAHVPVSGGRSRSCTAAHLWLNWRSAREDPTRRRQHARDERLDR